MDPRQDHNQDGRNGAGQDEIDRAWASFSMTNLPVLKETSLFEAHLRYYESAFRDVARTSCRPVIGADELAVVKKLSAEFKRYVREVSRDIEIVMPYARNLFVDQIHLPKYGPRPLQLVVDELSAARRFVLLAQLFNREHESLVCWSENLFPYSRETNNRTIPGSRPPPLMIQIEKRLSRVEQRQYLRSGAGPTFSIKMLYSPAAFAFEAATMKRLCRQAFREPDERPYFLRIINDALHSRFPMEFPQYSSVDVPMIDLFRDDPEPIFVVNAPRGRFLVKICHDAPKHAGDTRSLPNRAYSYQAQWQAQRLIS